MELTKLILLIFVLKISKVASEECGKRRGFQALGFGGRETLKQEWPWLAAFIYLEENSFMCGGSILSRSHVLSGKKFENFIEIFKVL